MIATELFLMLCQEFPDCGNQVMGNLHNRHILIFKRGFILGHSFLGRLLLVVREYGSNSVFVPSLWKCFLVHFWLRRLRLR